RDAGQEACGPRVHDSPDPSHTGPGSSQKTHSLFSGKVVACVAAVIGATLLLGGCRLVPEKEEDPKKKEKTEKWTEPQVDAAHAESYALPQGDVAEMWDTPFFKRQFVAGYGVSSDVEPKVSPDEVAILE